LPEVGCEALRSEVRLSEKTVSRDAPGSERNIRAGGLSSCFILLSTSLLYANSGTHLNSEFYASSLYYPATGAQRLISEIARKMLTLTILALYHLLYLVPGLLTVDELLLSA
jgi:hypothetical protein